MELILIRHAQTAWNTRHSFQGSSDTPLSEWGVEQARRLGERLKNKKIDRIISSPKKRAFDTAQAIAAHHGLTVEIEERIKEIHYGRWEGKNFDDLETEGDPDIGYYRKDRDFYGFPGDQSLFSARCRIGAYLDELKRQYWETDATIVLVGHAAIFRMGIFHLLDIGNIYYEKMEPANAAMTIFRIDKEKGLKMLCFNDGAHLE